MRVDHILRSMAKWTGGPPRSARGLGNGLTRLGAQTMYWSTATDKDMAELAAQPDVRAFYLSWPKSFWRSGALSRALRREIHAIDILHVHGVWSHPHFSAAHIGHRSQTPFVIAPRGEFKPWSLRNTPFKYLKKRVYLASLGSYMLRHASCLHAITPAEVHGFREAGYDGPVTVVPNAVDAEQFTQLPPRDAADERWPALRTRRVVLFLSRLDPNKGLTQLIPAWADVVRERKADDAILVLAGADHRGYERVVDGLLERHNVRKNVLLTGFVGGEDKRALLSRADLYVLPSFSEGFSVSLLENLAAANPVLITPGCNFPEVAEVGAGLSVEPERPALRDALRDLLGRARADLEAMGQRGRELVENNYTWDISAGKMMTVYQCILSGRSIPEHPQVAGVSR